MGHLTCPFGLEFGQTAKVAIPKRIVARPHGREHFGSDLEVRARGSEPSDQVSCACFRYSEGVFSVSFLKIVLKEDLELNPASCAMARIVK